MRILLSLFFIITVSFLTFGQKVLTLNEAISIALNRNTTLKTVENNLTTYESEVKSSYGNLFPTLAASGSWNWRRDENAGGVFPTEGGLLVFPPSTTESRNYSAGVGTNWVLFDGLANYANVSRSKNDLEGARLSLARLKEEIVFQTINFYYEVINTQQLLIVKEEDVKWNQKNLETITERNKLGAVTLADVYAQQVRAGNAELEVIRTRNNLETAKSNLLYYLGLDVLEPFTFSDAMPIDGMNPLQSNFEDEYKNLSTIVEQALNNRTDYRSARLGLLSAQNNVTMAWSGHLPRLSNSASFGTSANRFNDLFDSKSYSVGLTLSVPIFSGFDVEHRVQLAEVNVMNSEIEVSDLERDIKRNIQKTFLDLQASEKALEVSKRNVVAAEENRKIEEEKYSLGSGTLLNVLIANSEYTTAQTNFIDAQFAYIVLSDQLKYFMGILDYKKFE
jgi:outer membrane protein